MMTSPIMPMARPMLWRIASTMTALCLTASRKWARSHRLPGTPAYVPFYLWALLIAFTVLLSLDGVMRPEDEDAASSP